MPDISPVADRIAEKVQNEKQEQNPNFPKVPQPEKKKRGRPPNDPNAPKKIRQHTSRLGGIQDAGQLSAAAEATERLATALFVVECMERSGLALAGNAGKMHEVEKSGMVGIWDRYLLKAGIRDIPPGVMVCLITGQYYARVLAAPEAAPKTAKLKFFLSTKIAGIFGRFKNARSSRGNDRKRENNSGQTASESIQGEGN